MQVFKKTEHRCHTVYCQRTWVSTTQGPSLSLFCCSKHRCVMVVRRITIVQCSLRPQTLAVGITERSATSDSAALIVCKEVVHVSYLILRLADSLFKTWSIEQHQ